MKWIKRTWTAAEADEWTKEDWITIILSPTAYILISIGVAGSFLLQVWGQRSISIFLSREKSLKIFFLCLISLTN